MSAEFIGTRGIEIYGVTIVIIGEGGRVQLCDEQSGLRFREMSKDIVEKEKEEECEREG